MEEWEMIKRYMINSYSDNADEEFCATVELALQRTNNMFHTKLNRIRNEIEESLRHNDKELFMKLTKEYNMMKLEI